MSRSVGSRAKGTIAVPNLIRIPLPLLYAPSQNHLGKAPNSKPAGTTAASISCPMPWPPLSDVCCGIRNSPRMDGTFHIRKKICTIALRDASCSMWNERRSGSIRGAQSPLDKMSKEGNG